MIRHMVISDITQVVTIHLTSFPGFFLSFLGHRFLVFYYSNICSASDGISFVYLDSAGNPAGFVAGATNPGKFYSRLLKQNWVRFSFASLSAICRKPTVIKRIARALFHPSQNPSGDEVAGLFSIGVLPELQGTGTGKELVQKFLKEANSKGCKRVFLTTDRDNNDKVNTFYQEQGFRIDRQYVTPEGRRMNEYWIDIS